MLVRPSLVVPVCALLAATALQAGAAVLEAPQNDDLAAAVEIAALPFTAETADTLEATDESGEVPASCGSEPGEPERGVWYRFVAGETGRVELTTEGSDFDTVLSVWVGGPGHPLTEVACNDDDLDGWELWSRLALNVRAGTTYFVKAGGLDGDAGLLELSVTAAGATVPPPPNDDLAAAFDIVDLPFADMGTTEEATDEPGEEVASCGGGLELGVWYRFRPALSGPVTLTTDGSGFDTVLSVWTGGRGHPLTEVACNDDDPRIEGLWSWLELEASAGTTYFIKVGGLDGTRGAFELWVQRSTSAVYLPIAFAY